MKSLGNTHFRATAHPHGAAGRAPAPSESIEGYSVKTLPNQWFPEGATAAPLRLPERLRGRKPRAPRQDSYVGGYEDEEETEYEEIPEYDYGDGFGAVGGDPEQTHEVANAYTQRAVAQLQTWLRDQFKTKKEEEYAKLVRRIKELEAQNEEKAEDNRRMKEAWRTHICNPEPRVPSIQSRVSEGMYRAFGDNVPPFVQRPRPAPDTFYRISRNSPQHADLGSAGKLFPLQNF
eukprot:gene15119-biopygen3209